MNEDTGPQGTNTRPTMVATTAISKIQLGDQLKNYLNSSLQHEVPYAGILNELSGGMNQVKKNNLIFNQMNQLMVVHDQSQDVDLDFCRIVVPNKLDSKSQIVWELHSTPYSAHPGIQQTIAQVRRSFFWKGMLGDV